MAGIGHPNIRPFVQFSKGPLGWTVVYVKENTYFIGIKWFRLAVNVGQAFEWPPSCLAIQKLDKNVWFSNGLLCYTILYIKIITNYV